MGIEGRLGLRLRDLARQSAARTRRSSNTNLVLSTNDIQPLSIQEVVRKKGSSASYSAPFKPPAAYANTDADPAVCVENQSAQRPSVSRGQVCEDNRCSKRKPVNLIGILKNDGSSLDIDILVKDMSTHGACLVIDRNNPNRQLPSENPFVAESFELNIPFDKMTVQCELIWRNGDTFGASFKSTPVFQR